MAKDQNSRVISYSEPVSSLNHLWAGQDTKTSTEKPRQVRPLAFAYGRNTSVNRLADVPLHFHAGVLDVIAVPALQLHCIVSPAVVCRPNTAGRFCVLRCEGRYGSVRCRYVTARGIAQRVQRIGSSRNRLEWYTLLFSHRVVI